MNHFQCIDTSKMSHSFFILKKSKSEVNERSYKLAFYLTLNPHRLENAHTAGKVMEQYFGNMCL